MEEILASIRRIISEDDAPASKPTLVEMNAQDEDDQEDAFGEVEDTSQVQPQFDTVHAVAAEPERERMFQPEPQPEPVSAASPFEPEPASDSFYRASSPAPQPVPEPASSMLDTDSESLISKSVGASVASAFGALSRNVPMPAPGRSLEDLVKEMMKPMLRDWLDQNLAGIVEAKVQAEVERLSRQM